MSLRSWPGSGALVFVAGLLLGLAACGEVERQDATSSGQSVEPAATVSGRLVDATSGEPVAGVAVSLHVLDARSRHDDIAGRPASVVMQHLMRRPAVTRSQEDGSFSLPAVDAREGERAYLFAHRHRAGETVLEMVLQPLATREATWAIPEELQLGDPAVSRIEGRVTHRGRAVPGASVAVAIAGIFARGRHAVRADQEGYYRVVGLYTEPVGEEMARVQLALQGPLLAEPLAQLEPPATTDDVAPEALVSTVLEFRPGMQVREDFDLTP